MSISNNDGRLSWLLIPMGDCSEAFEVGCPVIVQMGGCTKTLGAGCPVIYQQMTALRLGVLSSCQWIAALRHSELGVLSSYEQTAIVRHLELSCIVLNRYTCDLSEFPNDPVCSSGKGQRT